MIRIAVITGSTRPGRRVDMVADWVLRVGRKHIEQTSGDIDLELVDLARQGLPLLDEPLPAAIGEYQNPHTLRWAQKIAAFDGFIFVVPEHNHSAPAAIKNAIDYLFAEWNDKAAGFVSYGIQGGVRAVEHLRAVMGEVKIADVRTQVAFSLFADFDIADMAEPGRFVPGDHHEPILGRLLDEVHQWSQALKALRDKSLPELAESR